MIIPILDKATEGAPADKWICSIYVSNKVYIKTVGHKSLVQMWNINKGEQNIKTTEKGIKNYSIILIVNNTKRNSTKGKMQNKQND